MSVKFLAHYSGKRLKYINSELIETGMVNHIGGERLRKTACFYSEPLNVYIDTSDGVNEDLDIEEYCGRAIRIIEDANEKPFLFFKSAYSPVKSKKIINMVEQNNGKVVPFFKWSFNDDFYNDMLPNKDYLIKKRIDTQKTYDIGIFAGTSNYEYPKPNSSDSRVAWSDYKNFGLGSPENTGHFQIDTRRRIFNNLKESNVNFFQSSKLPYKEYINKSFECKMVLNPPGMGEYTSRMVDQSVLGKCVVLRKTSYDQGHSWQGFYPQIDFDSPSWKSDFDEVLNNHEEWGKKAKQYYNDFWTPQAIVDFFTKTIRENL